MENTTVVGIHKLELYIPDSYLTLNSLAEHHDIAPGKYILGIGQSKMAVPSPDEDVITLEISEEITNVIPNQNSVADSVNGINTTKTDMATQVCQLIRCLFLSHLFVYVEY